MAFLRKAKPGSAPGGLSWSGPDDVVEVDDALAFELLRQPDGGFSEVLPQSSPTPAGDQPALPTKKADLQALADALGLDSSGTVKELAARITAHQVGEVKVPVEESNGSSEGDAQAEGAVQSDDGSAPGAGTGE